MTNFEKYKDKILELVNSDTMVALVCGRPCNCKQLPDCSTCSNKIGSCQVETIKWLYAEAPEIDWSKVPVDAKVRVSMDGEKWANRYFAKYENGLVCCWGNGTSSFTAYSTEDVSRWKYAELVEE